MGGFHLGFPGAPTENVGLTAPGLTELEVATAMPTHSSALRTHVQLCRDLSANYAQRAVGTVLHFAR
jgi:metal-dependent hydrolase (beta-lactamase superfamily II)